MKKFKRQLLLLLAICIIVPLLLPFTSSAAIKISKSNLIMNIGQTESIKITGTSKAAKWSSNKKSVATVSSKGKVKAIGKGIATIKATVGNNSYSCKVTVKTSNKSLKDLEKYLLNKKVISGKRTETAAYMIGAKDGFKYSDQSVEIYEYDTSSDEYKTLLKTNKVELQGFDYEINVNAINGKFVLIFSNEETSSKIIKAFNSFK